ncbi:MAG: Flp pilus assembly protein CpaB [Myxococcota bacterium]
MARTLMLAGALMAAAGLLLFKMHTERFETAVTGGREASILVAALDLRPGEPLTRNALAVETIPEAYLESRHVRLAEFERVLGTRTDRAIPRGTALRTNDFDPRDSRFQALSGLVQPSRRAVTLRTNAETFNSMVRRGDHVDVILSYAPAGLREQANAASQLITQNARVLAVGDVLGIPGESVDPNRKYLDITLEVPIPEVPRLHHATQMGELQLVIRNIDDESVVRELPRATDSDLLENLNALPQG